MYKPRFIIQRLACLLGVGVFVLAPSGIIGCSEGGVSDTIRVPASKRPDLDPQATTGTIIVPTDQPFNVVAFRSGQDGAARGEAQPLGKDGALLKVEAGNGGSAWAEFQLGYCFDNMGDKPLTGVVRFQLAPTQLSTAYNSGGADSTAAASTASIDLTAFIKSSAGILVKEEPLASSTLLKGPSSAERPYDLVFDLDIQPMAGYYLVLAGRAEVQSLAGQNASASLEVPKCSVEIRWNPSNANSTAPDHPENADRPQPAAAAGSPASDSRIQ